MRVTPPDLEHWLTSYLRAVALEDGREIDVDNKEPEDLSIEMSKPLVVIRDDSGSRLDLSTFDRSIGASVLAGSKVNDQPANDLARWVAGVLFDFDLPLVDGTPIAAVIPDGCNGPYPVADQLDVARRYMTAQYTVVGSW